MASDGTEGNGYGGVSSISADGRYILFESTSSNFAAGDIPDTFDIFVHDRDSDNDGIYGEAGDDDATEIETTDEVGFYEFKQLGAGAYRVVVTPPAGVQTGDPDAVVDHQTDITLFSNRKPDGTISCCSTEIGLLSPGIICYIKLPKIV